MKVKRIISIALAVAVISFVAPAYANAQPPAMPHTFYGTLLINGSDAPKDTVVEARGEGVISTLDNPITTNEIGKYGGPDWTDQKLAVQGQDITTITFWVQRPTDAVRHQANETATWESMKVEELPLTVDIPVVIPVTPPGGGGGGGGLDTTPPVISAVSLCPVGVTETTADICWITNELSTSQVEYWASPGMLSTLDETLVTDHHVNLTGLTPATTYHYKTMSKDSAGNLVVSPEYTFTTLEKPLVPGPAPPAPTPPAPAPPAPAPPAPPPAPPPGGVTGITTGISTVRGSSSTFISLYYAEGELMPWGYSQVISPAYNQPDWVYARRGFPTTGTVPNMLVGKGYLVAMVNPQGYLGQTGTPWLGPWPVP